MYNVKAYAIRKKGDINVTVSGDLPDSCYEARIVDKYPGGDIRYVKDPGSAQVFIEEKRKPGTSPCRMVLVPWVSHVNIPDKVHKEITVFINSKTKPVTETQVQKEPEQYRVIALNILKQKGHTGCSVVPEDLLYPGIYSSVFGPATKAECEDWLMKYCNKIKIPIPRLQK
jgi:hypothetical protein